MGQLGTLFAEGLSRVGRQVIPVRRGERLADACRDAEPALILLAVGEDDLSSCLSEVPPKYLDRVALLQNELRPLSFRATLGNLPPTIAIVWFEKREGSPPREVIPTVLYGPRSEILGAALSALHLSHRTVPAVPALCHELALKNLYILGLNLSGLVADGTAGSLLREHSVRFSSLTSDLLLLEQSLLSRTGEPYSEVILDKAVLLSDLERALRAEPDKKCAGRSAPRRLVRTLTLAKSAGLDLVSLKALSQALP